MSADPRGLIRPIHGKEKNNYERVHDRTYDILNGSVSLGGVQPNNVTGVKGHIDNVHIDATSPAAPNTEFAVTHNLGRIPSGCITVQTSNGGVIYKSGTAWTKTQVFLKSTTGTNEVVLMIY